MQLEKLYSRSGHEDDHAVVEGSQHSKKKQILIGLGVVGGVILILAAVKAIQIYLAIAAHAHAGPPPVAVTTLVAQRSAWPRIVTAVGSIDASQGALLGTQISGEVATIRFTSGTAVKKGDVLIELDTSVEEAELRSAEAVLHATELGFRRAKELRTKRVNSQADLDTAEAEYLAAKAQTDSIRRKIARLRIIAPFDGQAGIRRVNIGDYVSAGTTLVPLYRLNPLFINFAVPQQEVTDMHEGLKVLVSLPGNRDRSWEATLSAIDPQLDPQTRNVRLQATLKNEDGNLRPGMFVEVQVQLPTIDHFITLPASSISYAPYGNSVYKVTKKALEDGTEAQVAEPQFVQTGPQRGEQVAIVSGLEEGVEVVTSGTFKVRPGVPLIINNSVQPGNEANPNVPDT